MKPLDKEVLDAGSTKRRRSRWLLIPKTLLPVAAIVAAGFGADYFIRTKPEVPTRPAREQVYVIETTAAVRADIRPKITVYGEIVAGRTVDLRALVGGEIVSVSPKLKSGAIVEAGEVLVEIDRFAYEGAVTEARANLSEARAKVVESEGRITLEQASLRRAREQLDLAKRDLERAEKLESTGAIAAKSLDDRRLLVSQRSQAVDQHFNTLAIEQSRLQQQLTAIERLEWRFTQAERNLRDTTLKAPFRAVVRTTNAEIGRLANVNDVIASLYDADRIEARFSLSDKQFGRIIADVGGVAGRKVEVRWHLGETVERYEGMIDRSGADVVSSRGGIDLFARIEPAADRPALRPGTFVEIVLDDRVYERAIALPETAIYGGDHVFIVVDDRLQRRDVELLAYDGDTVLVDGDIADGAAVLTTRIAEIGEGLKVRSPDPASPRGRPGDQSAKADTDAATPGARP
ncbi:MAG: HlyD family efflux transporter periplasmic adaptor subunit [Hyphomicrobiales bacterium]|nr:HlyD family efflux transporter periplasmic adaptor subunit [Hyphomicrobiales bacterium]